jgi:hypothetical protein
MFHHGDSEGRFAAGISLSLEQLVCGATSDCEDDLEFCDMYDIYVCSTSSSVTATKEKAQVFIINTHLNKNNVNFF